MRTPLPQVLTPESLDAWLMDQFVCPVEHAPLTRDGNWLINTQNSKRRYPIVNDVPVFLRDDIEHTAWWSRESLKIATSIANGEREFAEQSWNGEGVHPHVQAIIASTGGHLYQHCKGNLTDYPIPTIRVQNTGDGQLMLDCGCNWSR